MDDQFSFSSNTAIVLEDGVIAWRTGSGTIGAAAYKWGTNAWIDQQFDFSASSTMPTITDGTVQWNNSNVPFRWCFELFARMRRRTHHHTALGVEELRELGCLFTATDRVQCRF